MKKVAILLLFIVSLSADQLKVPSEYSTIQAAIDVASNGDTVSVAAGTYNEKIYIANKNLTLIGENRDNTIIDCNQSGTNIVIGSSSGTNYEVNISNFSIINGNQDGSDFYPDISAWPYSGGIFVLKTKVNLENLIVKNNDGGGIGINSSPTNTLKNIVVTKNIEGGIFLNWSGALMSNILISENKSTNVDGAGLNINHCYDDSGTTPFKFYDVELINVTIANNTMDMEDGYNGLDWANGIKTYNSDFKIINSTIWNNDDKEILTKIGLNYLETPSYEITYSNIEGGYTGTGNIDSNPKFMKVVTTGDEDSDYHLKDSSPAIGTGTATGAPTTDIEGNPRPNPAGSNPDMGAYENKWGTPQNATPVITAMNDVTVNEDKSYSDTLRATDDEGDAITYSVSSDTSAVTASITDSILTITLNRNWNGVAKITAYASDGYSNDSTSFKLTVTPVNDEPTAFEWVSTALDTINITKTNLADTYTLQWDASTDVDGDSINYLVYAKVGVYPAEEIYDTTVTSVSITYQEILEGVFEGSPVNGATVKLTLYAHDGTDSTKVTGDDRVLYVNRYDYLSVEGEGIPTEFALHENYPNPFNPTTTLRFDLPEVSDITLTIYNMLGQKVRTFNYQNTSAGYHSVKWNATNDYGEQVGAGVYLYQLRAKQFVKTRKMVLLK